MAMTRSSDSLPCDTGAGTRSGACLVAIGFAALLWSQGASSAGDRVPRASNPMHGPQSGGETACETKTLDAAADYFQCLIGNYQTPKVRDGEAAESAIAKCDDRFLRDVEKAQAKGSCLTPGNPAILGDSIKDFAQATALRVTAESGGCTSLKIANGFATCELGVGNRSVDLIPIIGAINRIGGTNIDDTATLYIEAWGGDGGPGIDSDLFCGAEVETR